MRFDFDDTQYALRDLARDLFAKESPPSRLRALWEGREGKPFERDVWKTMADAGIVGLTVPEEYGGSGGDEIDLALVYEEAGRAALPEPLLETTGVAVPMLVDAGTDEQKDRWLGAIAQGDAIVAVEEPDAPFVAWASEADLLLCVRDTRAHAVPRDRFRATPVKATDPSRPVAAVEIDADEKTAMAGPGMIAALLRGAYGTAALLNGISMRLLETTVNYVRDREQFGRPVGSFQAIKHKLAAMHQAIETSRPATWYAAYALARALPDALEAASVAKAAASDTEALCNGEALQCHGGIGFTWEDDLHLWLKRGIALRSAWGTAADHRRRLVPTVLGEI